MKKLWMLALAAGLTLLSGCSDAVAEISNGDKVLFKVGDETITRDDMYATYKSSASNYVIEKVKKYIAEKEVPVTDEMKDEAQKELDTFKSSNGAETKQYLELNGFKDEKQYLNDYLLVNIRTNKLPEVFIKNNFNKQAKKYHPVKVQILEADELQKAQTALEEIKGGKDFKEATTTHGNTTNFSGDAQVVTSETTTLPATVFKQLEKNTKSNILLKEVISDTTSGKYYVVKVIETDPNNFKEEAIQSLASIANMQTIAFTHYLKKYDFKIHDIDIFNEINSTQPDYIVQ